MSAPTSSRSSSTGGICRMTSWLFVTLDQSQPGRGRLLPHLVLGLLERDMQAALALLQARGDEAQGRAASCRPRRGR